MSRNTRKLDLTFVESIVEKAVQAYPGRGQSNDEKDRIRNRVENSIETWPHQDLYGVIEDDELLASLCLFQFHINCRGEEVRAAGIGSVGTGLLHRKKHAAWDLLLSALMECRAQNRPLVALYPFRTGFYRKMGFGYGVEIRRYQLNPLYFPDKPMAGYLRWLKGSDEDRRATIACYDAMVRRTHGMGTRLDTSMGDAFQPETPVIGYESDGVLKGYMVLSYISTLPLKSDLCVKELVYDSSEALHAFSGLLHRQSDQFQRIILETDDDQLAFLLQDIGSDTYDAFASWKVETCAVASGVMYRIVDVPGLFAAMADHPFDVSDFTLKLTISDDFLLENDGETTIAFRDGQANVVDSETADVELALDIGSFSSLFMGATDLKSLLRLGMASISSERWAKPLTTLFRTDAKPRFWQFF